MHDFLTSLLGGAVTGAIECAVCQPFDMVKTRHQINTGVNPSTFRSLRAIYLEGGVPRFYRGVLPELSGMVPKSMSMYATYDACRRSLSARTEMDEVTIALVSGAASGPAEAVVVQPFQVVKVRMQAKEHVGRYRSSLHCALEMMRSEGVGVFVRSGAVATVCRNVVWNTLYFGSMAKVRAVLEMRRVRNGGIASPLDTCINAASGFGCGVFATLFNAPFDVAKSRQQSQMPRTTTGGIRASDNAALPSNGTFGILARIAREEGLSACWRGLGPKAWRMGLAGLVGLQSFELVQWLLGSSH
jgi:hypothetical protein